MEKRPDGETRTIIKTEPSGATSYTLDDIGRIGRGNFSWQVEAVALEGNTIKQRGRPGENSFTVDIPRPNNPRPHEPGTVYGSAE